MSTVTVSDTPFVGSDRLLVGIVLSVLTFWLFAQSVINVVPAMKSSLDISLETLTLAVSLSALFSGCFVVASGGLADKFGRMRMTTLGLGLSIIGSAMLVLAQGPGLFLAGRVLQGLSAACIMPATLALIKTWYQGRARQRAVSFWVIGSWGGSGLCSFVGGAIATGLGWRWIFVFSIAVALLALFLLRGTPESRSASASQHKLDVGGLLSLIVGLVLVNLFISKGHGWGWASPLSLSMLAGALIAGAVFIRSGLRKGEAALIDFALFRNRAYGAAVLSNFLLNGGDWHHDDRQHLATARAPPDAAGERNDDPRLSGYRPGDDSGRREAAAALWRPAADDGRPGADRHRHRPDILHLP
ncbi:transporter [Klebsiella quasipneumoniae]|nr:transporter [Klebsiella quasipneumoniae]